MNLLKKLYGELDTIIGKDNHKVKVYLATSKRNDTFDDLKNIEVLFNQDRIVNSHGYSSWYVEILKDDKLIVALDSMGKSLPDTLRKIIIKNKGDFVFGKNIDLKSLKAFENGNVYFLGDSDNYMLYDNDRAYRISTNSKDMLNLNNRVNDLMENLIGNFNSGFYNEHLFIVDTNKYTQREVDGSSNKSLIEKVELKAFDLDSINFTEQNEYPNRVYVIRNDNAYGYFEIPNEHLNFFQQCELTQHNLTGLVNKHNERMTNYSSGKYITNAYRLKDMFICEVCGNEHSKLDHKEINGMCEFCNHRVQNAFDTAELDMPSDTIEIKKIVRETIGGAHRDTTLNFLNVDNERNPLFMGVELEVDTGSKSYDDDYDDEYDDSGMEYPSDTQNAIAHKFIDILSPSKNAYAMWDGSLINGFEIATHPATLKSHLKAFDYKNAFAYLQKKSYMSHNAATCGLHIHLSRRYFGKTREAQLLNAAKMAYIMETYWDEFVGFSRRNYEQLDRWSRIGNLVGSVKNMTYDELVRGLNRYYEHDKYVALNLQHPNTFELRIFRGTLKYETFIATLTFVDKLAKLIKKTTLNDLTSIKFDDIIKGRIVKNYWNTRNGGNV